MLNKLKDDALQARKDRDLFASSLNTLLSEVKMRAKNDGNREPNDEDVYKIAQTTMASLLGNRDLLDTAGRDTTEVEQEMKVISAYVPTVMPKEEVEGKVQLAMHEIKPEGMQDMGKVMSWLKEKYGARIDMKLASQLFRERLNG